MNKIKTHGMFLKKDNKEFFYLAEHCMAFIDAVKKRRYRILFSDKI